jgi:integrase
MGGGGNRDFTLILVAYRHSLRAREICELEWSQVEFGRSAALHVRRVKNGKPSVHPIRGDELRMLTALRREFPNNGYVFISERGTPFTTDAVNRLVKTIGKRAKLSASTLPHAEVRLCPGQSGHRYGGHPGLAGPRLDHTHHRIHSTHLCERVSNGPR